MTFRELFISYLDIFGVPRRSFFEMLAHFTKDNNQTERLREFASPEGQVSYKGCFPVNAKLISCLLFVQDDMYSYCQRPRRTVAEVLFDFKSAEIPLEYILDVFPVIQPRSFSIASSPQVNIDFSVLSLYRQMS